MRVPYWFILSACSLLGCAAHPKPIVQAPMPDDIAWARPQAVEPTTPSFPSTERAPTPFEKVLDYEIGQVYTLTLAPGQSLNVQLKPGEQRNEVILNAPPLKEDEAPSSQGQASSSTCLRSGMWEVCEGHSGSGDSGRDHLIISVAKATSPQDMTVTTTERVYHLRLISGKASKARIVRWTYPPEPVKVSARVSILPDPSTPQAYHVGYQMTHEGPQPTWLPRQIVDNGRKTFILLPTNVGAMEMPMVRLLGVNGPELTNPLHVGSVILIDGLVRGIELRVGSGDTAEVVRIVRGVPERITCPGDPRCPVWPTAAAYAAR